MNKMWYLNLRLLLFYSWNHWNPSIDYLELSVITQIIRLLFWVAALDVSCSGGRIETTGKTLRTAVGLPKHLGKASMASVWPIRRLTEPRDSGRPWRRFSAARDEHVTWTAHQPRRATQWPVVIWSRAFKVIKIILNVEIQWVGQTFDTRLTVVSAPDVRSEVLVTSFPTRVSAFDWALATTPIPSRQFDVALPP